MLWIPHKKNSGCAYLPINGKAKYIQYPYCNDVTLLEHNTHNYECYQYPVSNKLLYKCEIDETNKDHPCKEVLKYSCSDVPEIPSNSNAKCKYFPVSINSNETHICTSDNNGRCKEEYKCNKVPKGENIDCSSYPVSDDFAYNCVKDDTSNIYACKEVIKKCSDISLIPIPEDSSVNCFDFPVSDNLVSTHKCFQPSYSKVCVEKKLCSLVDQNDDGLCGDYPTSDPFKYFCEDNNDGGTKCKESIINCNQVQEYVPLKYRDRVNCSELVSNSSSNEQKCIYHLRRHTCIESPICGSNPNVENVLNRDCSYLPVSEREYVCGNRSIEFATYCYEEIKKCSQVITDNKEYCSQFYLSENSKDTHACILNEEKEKCYEEYKCNKVPKIIKENDRKSCSYYPVSNISLFVCINDTTTDSNYSCKEEYLCDKVPKGENINCSYYPVINEDSICIKNDNNEDEYACKE